VTGGGKTDLRKGRKVKEEEGALERISRRGFPPCVREGGGGGPTGVRKQDTGRMGELVLGRWETSSVFFLLLNAV